MAQDISQRAQPEASFRVLSDVARLLVSESDLTHLLEAIADAVETLIPYDTLTIYEADLSLKNLRPVLVRDDHADEIFQHGTLRFGEGITGWAAERREAALVNDVDLDPRAHQIQGTPYEPEALLTVPLLARGELKGMLNLYRQGRGHGFHEGELDVAERFAEMAALALDNAQIRERLQAEIVTDSLTGVYNHRYFQERLAEELRRCARTGRMMSLVLVDIDDFKRVNEGEGHLAGDQVLGAVASVMRVDARPEDVVCRVGGEEFAIIMPGTTAAEALRAATALRTKIASTRFNASNVALTVSIGVAEGPTHANGPRELMACANFALLQAKADGGNGVSAYLEREWSGVRGVPQHEARMAGHLKLLQTLASKLNRLQDVRQIANTIILELRQLVDYHSCRVYLLDSDAGVLRPVAFHGELSEYEGETEDALICEVGEGLTGHAAETGESIYAADANFCEFAVKIPGTTDVEESLLAVPMKFDTKVTGVVVLSKLGLNQFDPDDVRLLESLASHAAVAFENARLFEEERQTADTASALLRVSQALTRTREPQRVLAEVVESLSHMLDCQIVSAWLRHPDGTFRCSVQLGHSAEDSARVAEMQVSAEVADRFLLSREEPFFLPPETVATVPEDVRLWPEGRAILVAPVRWEPQGMAALVAVSAEGEALFLPRDFRLARGVSDLASLAMGNATRFADLDNAFMQTVEVLANALEAKDGYTSGHAREVAELTVSVAREMGVPEEDLRTYELAGMFHDIGKIGILSEIINKPEPLDALEMEEMKRHPQIGAEILAPVEFLEPVRPIVRSCHERWDGLGYPDGLAGDQIPLGARIIFVCDAFHAMTSDRSYRTALPEEQALSRLREAAGTQFDPVVVEAFLAAHIAGRLHPHLQLHTK
jgi:diguanylate cyclase (GGDEF)-like protein/putative nucleotidyltransferase with HDIG domain